MEGKKIEYTPPEKDPLKYLQEFTLGAPEIVKREYARTANPWIACFITILTVVKARTQLHKNKLEELLSPEGYRSATEKLTVLEKRVMELKKQYPKKEPNPPEEIKQELFDGVNIFG